MASEIVVDPKIMAGAPVIAGTRIPVSLVINLLTHGDNVERIIDAYPMLSDEDIRAALRSAEASVKREEPTGVDDWS